MTVKAYSKGWPVVHDGENWIWKDSEIPIADEERPCKRCGKMPTVEGHDACMGFIEGMTSACCGHGVKEPFMM